MEMPRSDCSFVNTRLQESRQAEEAIIYSRIADLLDIGPASTHVDLAPGMGNLLAILRKRTPEAILIGVEPSVAMIEAADAHLRCEGITTVVHDKRGRLAAGDILKRDGSVALILDDVRNVRNEGALRRLIYNEIGGLDSASYAFPGCAPSVVRGRNPKEVMAEIRREIWEFMSQTVKRENRRESGGRVVIAEKKRDLKRLPNMHWPSNPTVLRFIELVRERIVGANTDSVYWSSDMRAEMSDGRNGLASVKLEEDAALPLMNAPDFFFVHGFTRGNRSYHAAESRN